MSSDQRSNSAVRNLRSIFENRSSEQPSDARGRSPASDLDANRPRSKIRASFIPVQPTMAALAAEHQNADPTSDADHVTSARRTSFSEGRSGSVANLLQDAAPNTTVPENAVESAAPTPLVELHKELGAPKEDKPAEHPDKRVTGAEEDPAPMTAADPASEAAVSGGQALPPGEEDLPKTTSVSKTGTSRSAAKLSSISTKAVPRASTSSIKSPASQPKTPLSSTSQTAPTKKASRSSLTAPTAASVARAAAADKAASKQLPPVSKPKPREPTRPVDVSSRLTAPTAASRARLESSSASTGSSSKPPTTAARKPSSAPARPNPRASLARPDSRISQTSAKKNTAPVDGSFLERMTRPTAASANKTHEKTEVKSPPKQKQLPLRPKANGHAKPSVAATDSDTAHEEPAPVASTAAGEPVSASETHEASSVEEPSFLPEYHDQAPRKVPVAPESVNTTHLVGEEQAGNETPINGLQEDAATLEATPAAIGGEDSIR